MGVRFGLLGPLEVWEDDRELPLGSGRQRSLLALLLVHANEVVSVERLIEELWAGSPPPTAQKGLHVYVSQLRKLLPGDVLVTRSGGYLLRANETDVAEFQQLLASAGSQEPARAAATLERALSLYRGRPLAEFQYDGWAQAEIVRLEELRLAALEARIDAELELGRHALLVSELESLVSEHPLRERLWAQLMLALYRCGRQADALAAYQRARRKLDEELGLRPDPLLEQLERQILTHDAAIAPPVRRLVLPAVLSRKGGTVAIAGAVVLAGALGALAWQLTGGSSRPAAPTGSALVAVDPAGGGVDARIGVSGTPTSVAAGKGAVWLASAGEQSVSRVDPKGRRVVAIVRTGTTPTDIAIGAGAVWLVNGGVTKGSGLVSESYPDSVSRLDPGSGVVTRTVVLPRRSVDFERSVAASALAVTSGAVWAIDPDGGVSRIDPATGRIVATIEHLGARAIAASSQAVWVHDGNSTAIRIDPRTNRVSERVPLAAGSLEGIAIGAGAVWLADAVDGTLWRIDPDPTPVTRTVTVGIGVGAVSFGADTVWVSNSFLGTVSRIDARTNTVTRTIDVGGTPSGLAADASSVWLSVTGAPASGPRESGVEALPSTSCGPVVSGGGKAHVLIASDLPLHGGAASATVPMTRAIQLVLQRHHFRAGRFPVAYQSCDDSTAQAGNWDFGACGANAKAYAADRDLLGVIGPFNSGCALAEIPITSGARAGPVPLVSPLTTSPGLTHRGPATRPELLGLLYPTGRRNFVRIIAPDDAEGAALALLAHDLRLSRVFLLSDGDDFARTLTLGFEHAARRLRVGVAGEAEWDPQASGYAALARQVARSRPEGVLLGGFSGPPAGRLVRALRGALGPRVALLAGDGFLTIPYLLQVAGPAARGMYVSFAGRPNARLPAAGQEFVRAFAATQPSPKVPSYAAAYGAQAAEVLLAAIARSDGTRDSVVRELFALRVRGGILGDFSFASDGDMTPSPVTIFRVVGGNRRSSTHLEDFDGSIIERVVDVPVSLAR
jgi:YVTN family beta-propeller protein